MGTHCDFQVGTLTRFYEIVFGLVHLSFVSVTAVFNQYHYFTTFLVHVKVVGAFENAPLLRNFGERERERERKREEDREEDRESKKSKPQQQYITIPRGLVRPHDRSSANYVYHLLCYNTETLRNNSLRYMKRFCQHIYQLRS